MPPLAAEPLRRFLVAHAVPGLEHVEPDGTHVRSVDAPGGAAVVRLDWARVGSSVLPIEVELTDAADEAFVAAAVRRWLDLDADPAAVEAVLGADPLLAPLVAARPGLRIPGAIDAREVALFAVLGQQLSLAAARTFAARLVDGFAAPTGAGLRRTPDLAAITAAEPEPFRAAIGLTRSRAGTVQTLSAALADGLDLADRPALLALPGIGPWTADCLAVRSGDRHAFPAGDLVLRRALGIDRVRDVVERAEPWRPWRAYALLHLWTGAVFA